MAAHPCVGWPLLLLLVETEAVKSATTCQNTSFSLLCTRFCESSSVLYQQSIAAAAADAAAAAATTAAAAAVWLVLLVLLRCCCYGNQPCSN